MEKGSIEQFLVQNQRKLFGIAYGILRHGADAEDAVATATEKLLKKAHQFNGLGKFSNYAHQTVKNECLLLIRKNGRHRKWDWICHDTFVPEYAEPVERSEHAATRAQLLDLLKVRTGTKRASTTRDTVMALLTHSSNEEAAESLGVSLGVFRTRVHRAQRVLAQRLEMISG